MSLERPKLATCPRCHMTHVTTNKGANQELCEDCIANAEVTESFSNTRMPYYGEIKCWKDGIHREVLLCMERKAMAIKRFKDGLDYDCPYCRMCGASPDKMAEGVVVKPTEEVTTVARISGKRTPCSTKGYTATKEKYFYKGRCRTVYTKEGQRFVIYKYLMISINEECARR